MIDKPETQLTLKQGDSTLILSQVRCALVTRGLRDAAILQVSPDELVPLNKSVVKRLAEEGDAEAQFDVGLIYQFAGKYATGEPVPFGVSSTGEDIILEGPRDYAEAARWFRKAADQGTGHAQISLGEMYYQGQGVKQDYFGAVYWFRRAASQGFSSAIYALGRSYFNGEGVVKDYSEAIRLYTEAGQKGDLQAQMTLGSLYYGGDIVPQSFTESFTWYRKASEGWSPNAWCMVGRMYYDGTGIAQDRAEAARWFQKAANECNLEAQTKLGYMYFVGEGVVQSYEQAAYWYEIAAKRGDVGAQANLARALYRLGKSFEAYKSMKRAIGRLTGEALKKATNDLNTFADGLAPAELADAERG